MRYAEAIPGVLVLALRLATVPAAAWWRDVVVVLALLWVAICVTPPQGRARRWSVALACAWLGAVYAAHQAVWTLAGYR